MNHKVIFIATDELGLLAPLLTQMQGATTKRQRAAQHKEVCVVLRALGVIERQADVRGLAMGCERDGDRGLYIVLSIPDHIIAAIQTQGDNNESTLQDSRGTKGTDHD